MGNQLSFPELANALYLALKEDSFYIVFENSIEGDEAFKKQKMLAYLDYSITEAQNFGECYIPNEQHYGVSIWAYPLENDQANKKLDKKHTFIQSVMGNKPLEIYNQMCQFMAEKSKGIIRSNAWYLSIIGILPEFQGQGLGPGLVENVLEKTDKLGLQTYLETFTPRNMTFYQRLGYQVAGEFHEPLSDHPYWLMVREPA